MVSMVIVGNTDDPQTSTNDIYFANLISYMSSRPNFQGGGQFKLYRFHYRSDYQSVWQIARSLRNRIDDLVKQNPQLEPKKFVLIAHSMGGLVEGSYMNEHDTDFGSTYRGRRAGERIRKVITLATPHHGSPAANKTIRRDGSFSLGGHPSWGALFSTADNFVWGVAGCVLGPCTALDPSIPNRADLRYDNRTARTFSDYLYDPKEVNAWLRQIPHTYDHLITAYWGYIGRTADIISLGKKGPWGPDGLITEVTNRYPGGNPHLEANVASVLLERVWQGNFVSDITSVSN